MSWYHAIPCLNSLLVVNAKESRHSHGSHRKGYLLGADLGILLDGDLVVALHDANVVVRVLSTAERSATCVPGGE